MALVSSVGSCNRARATWDHMRVHRHRPLKFKNEDLQINPSSRNFHAGALVVFRPVDMYAGFRRRPPKAPKHPPSVPHVQMDSPSRPLVGTNRIDNTKRPPPPPVPVEPFEKHLEKYLREHAVGQRERAEPSVTMPPPLVAPPPLPPPPPLLIKAESAISETMWTALDAVANHNSRATLWHLRRCPLRCRL